MQIKTYKTHRISPQDSLQNLLDAYLPVLEEGSILVITSKIVSLCEGDSLPKEAVTSKKELIKSQADAYLSSEETAFPLTILNHRFLPFAGIDESNGNGSYILPPKNAQATAAMLWKHVRMRHALKEIGILITDSHITPMRRGVTGIALGWCGFKALHNYIGTPDCFGNFLKLTFKNNIDGLAAAAVLCMGEGGEQTPLAVAREIPHIEFQDRPPTLAEEQELVMPLKEDLFAALLQNAPWTIPL